MRRGFGQYVTDSGLDTSGLTVGGGAAVGDMTTQQLNLLPFGGSSIAGEIPIQGGVSCFRIPAIVRDQQRHGRCAHQAKPGARF